MTHSSFNATSYPALLAVNAEREEALGTRLPLMVIIRTTNGSITITSKTKIKYI